MWALTHKIKWMTNRMERGSQMNNKRKVRVALLFGGKSGEHEVSLLSARSIMEALSQSETYEIYPIGITKEGKWLNAGDSRGLLATGREAGEDHREERMLHAMDQQEEAVQNPSVTVRQEKEPQGLMNRASFNLPSEIDVVFPVLHGPNGEDGTVQGLLQLADLPYVGAGVLASATGMDKVIMKNLFAHAGIPQANYLHYLRKDLKERLQEVVAEIEEKIGYPCFVKPANLGSSVGISKAKNREELAEALSLAANYDRKIIIEENIPAREIEMGVLGNDDPIVSVPGEILAGNEFYDYEAKYRDGKSRLIIPAKVTDGERERLGDLAIRAFRAIDGSGLSRVDFFIHKETGEVLVNEINTMPGFTPYSMYPLLWQHSGLSYESLIDRLIKLALERYEERKNG